MTKKIHYPRVRPATDIVDMEDGVRITANMPGVNEQDLQVILEGNVLHITASSRCPIPTEKKDVQTLEFGNVEFFLDIVMGGDCSNFVETSLNKGVLSIFLPREAVSGAIPVDLHQPF